MPYSGSNFSVYIRNRGPVNSSSWTATSREITRHSPALSKSPKQYQFDRVFGHECTQEDVFETCAEPLLEHFLSGYNSTIFAYGQTGTGKTHTMAGDCTIYPPTNSLEPTRLSSILSPSINGSDSMRFSNSSMQMHELSDEAGLQPRILQAVLERLNGYSGQVGHGGQEWLLEISCFEVYNEEIRDLLSPRQMDRLRKPLMIATNKSTQTVEVMGISSRAVRSLSSALAVLQEAMLLRKTDSTNLNAHSSRSHMITTLTLLTKHSDTGMAVRSKLNLVDLAGSECVGRSGAVDAQAKEAGLINKSLLALGNIISNLVMEEGKSQDTQATFKPLRRSHISYRDSKLTHLLQDSLGGRTKTVMIATVNLANSSHNENVSTLEYAMRARAIRNKEQTELELTSMPNTLEAYGRKLEQIQSELVDQRRKDGVVQLSEPAYNDLKIAKHRYSQKLTSAQADLKRSLDEIHQLKQHIKQLDKVNVQQSAELKEYRLLEDQHLLQHENSENLRLQTGQIQRTIHYFLQKVETLSSEVFNNFAELPLETNNIASALSEKIRFNISSWLVEEVGMQLRNAGNETIKIQFGDLSTDLEVFVENIEQIVRKSVDMKTASINSALSSVISDLVQMRVSTSQLLETFGKIENHIEKQTLAESAKEKIIRVLLESEVKAQEAARVEAERVQAEANERIQVVSKLLNNEDENELTTLGQHTQRALHAINAVNSIAERFNERAEPLHSGLKPSSLSKETFTEAIPKLQSLLDIHLGNFQTQLAVSTTNVMEYYRSSRAKPEDAGLVAIKDRLDNLESQILRVCDKSRAGVTELDKNQLLSQLASLTDFCRPLSTGSSILERPESSESYSNKENPGSSGSVENPGSSGSAFGGSAYSPQRGALAGPSSYRSTSGSPSQRATKNRLPSTTLYKPTKASLLKSYQLSPQKPKNSLLNGVPKLSPLKNHQPQSPKKQDVHLKNVSNPLASPLRKLPSRFGAAKASSSMSTKLPRLQHNSSGAKRFKSNER